jgi:hypothetical protein
MHPWPSTSSWTRSRRGSGGGTVNASIASIVAKMQGGTGAPNGVVTGSVGDRYVDRSATLGARVWYKATGTATNTGWLVAEGDTGLRSIGTLLNGWTNSGAVPSTIRRYGDVVQVYLCVAQAGVVPTASNVYTMPVGFRPPQYLYSAFMRSTAWHQIEIRDNGAFVCVDFASFTGNAASHLLTYLTRDAWPTTLPGTAA